MVLPAGRPNPFDSNGAGSHVVDVPAPRRAPSRFERIEKTIEVHFDRRPWLAWALFYVVEIGAVVYLGSRIDHLANTIQLK